MTNDYSFVFPKTDLIELGIHEYFALRHFNLTHKMPNLSLHLARSPMCGDESAQDYFLAHLKEILDSHSFYSLGFHLCGPRNSNIERYGFTSHYSDTNYNRRQTSRFFERLRKFFKGNVWVENANFYSSNLVDFKNAAEVDLSGMIIDNQLFFDTHDAAVDIKILNQFLKQNELTHNTYITVERDTNKDFQSILTDVRLVKNLLYGAYLNE